MILSRRVLLRAALGSTRSLSSRAANVLSALEIPTTADVCGVYDGEWKGSGDLVSSVCPTTGEVLARVKTVSTTTPADLYPAQPGPRPRRRNSTPPSPRPVRHMYFSEVRTVPYAGPMRPTSIRCPRASSWRDSQTDQRGTRCQGSCPKYALTRTNPCLS